MAVVLSRESVRPGHLDRRSAPWQDLRPSKVSDTLALTLLREAAEQFDRVDMKLYASVARRRLAELQNDDEGRELGRWANAWMASQQSKNPAAFTRMLAAGFPERMP